MRIIELRPTGLGELAGQLDSVFGRTRALGVRVARERDAVRVEGELRRPEWSMVWNEPVCTWRLGESEVRFVLAPFRTIVQFELRRFTLLITPRQPSEDRGKPQTAGLRPSTRPVHEVFMQRALKAVARLGELQEPVLKSAIAESSDQGVLVRALESPEALEAVEPIDPLLQARLRGISEKRRLLESHGGTLSTEEAGELLKITRQAVDKRRRKGQLLAVELGKRGNCYPAWQFGDAGVVPGLDKALAALSEHDPWMQMAFFTAPNPMLGGRAPIQALAQKRIEEVLGAARAYGEQGAA